MSTSEHNPAAVYDWMRRGSRAQRALDAEVLHAHLLAHGDAGESIGRLARSVRLSVGVCRRVLYALRDAGRAELIGEPRLARWRATRPS